MAVLLTLFILISSFLGRRMFAAGADNCAVVFEEVIAVVQISIVFYPDSTLTFSTTGLSTTTYPTNPTFDLYDVLADIVDDIDASLSTAPPSAVASPTSSDSNLIALPTPVVNPASILQAYKNCVAKVSTAHFRKRNYLSGRSRQDNVALGIRNCKSTMAAALAEYNAENPAPVVTSKTPPPPVSTTAPSPSPSSSAQSQADAIQAALAAYNACVTKATGKHRRSFWWRDVQNGTQNGIQGCDTIKNLAFADLGLPSS